MDRSEAQEISSTIAVVPHGNDTDERALGDGNESNASPATAAVTTLPLPPTTPPRASSTSSLSQSLTLDHHHLAPHNTCSPSSRPSLLRSPSRRMMYADALNCGNHIHSRINACSNHVAKCSNSGSGSHGGGGNATSRTSPGCSSTTTSADPRSISYSEMFSRYDEECNICLTQFQVGDSAAWSMQYGKMVLSGGNSSSDLSTSLTTNDENDVCKHVFHEECISRWLLVRNGCPICRRSYFSAITTMTAADGTSENATVDLERGLNSEG